MASKKASSNKDSSMKVILVVALALAFIAGYLVSRARYKPQILDLNKMVMERDESIKMMKASVNRIMKHDDTLWMIEDGILREVEEEVTLSDGSVVGLDGTVTRKDGSQVMLQNGDSIGMEGTMLEGEDLMNTDSMMKTGF